MIDGDAGVVLAVGVADLLLLRLGDDMFVVPPAPTME